MFFSSAQCVIHIHLTIVRGVFRKTEGAGRLAHIAEVSFEAARRHPDQHSQLRGEDRECMRNELWKVHSFVLARREDLFAYVGIDAAFQYIDELIFASVHVCWRFVPRL